MKTNRLITALAASALMLGFGAYADDTRNKTTTEDQKRIGDDPSMEREKRTGDTDIRKEEKKADSVKLGMGDKKFLNDTAESSLAEIEFAKLAQKQSNNEAVKDYSKRIEEDHGKVVEELRTIAKNHDFTLASSLSLKDKARLERFEGLRGQDFDDQFAKAMIDNHEKSINHFKKQIRGAKHEDLKEFATRTLPTLEEHLKMAKDLQKKPATTMR